VCKSKIYCSNAPGQLTEHGWLEEFAQDFTKVESAKHILYDILHNHLSDFDIFVQHILDYLFT
jgi:hypothetical protein